MPSRSRKWLGVLWLVMAFSYYKAFTTDATQAGSADSTNFPITINVTDTDLRTAGNGGYLQNANGYDARPYSDTALTGALTFELVYYNATTGQLEMHVKVGTLSHTVNLASYLAFGDASISTDGSSTSTWDSNFKGVFHLKDGSTLSVADSTGLNTATNNGATATTGQIDGGAAFSSQYIDGGNAAAITSNALTISAWVKPSVTSRGDLVTRWTNGVSASQFNLLYGLTSGKPQFYVSDTTALTSGVGVTAMSTGTWYLLHGRDNGTNIDIFLNAGSQATLSFAHTLVTASLANYRFGNNANADGSYTGALDEIRISNSVRSTSWMTSEYNNQKPSSTFLTWGSLVVVGGGGTARVRMPLLGVS